MIELTVLGPIEVRRVDDGELVAVRGELQHRLLLALFLAEGRVVTVDQLADMVWLEEPPPSAVGSLRTYVNRLRRALGPAGQTIETVTGGYLLRVDFVRSDTEQVAQLLREDRATLHPSDRLGLLEKASALWRGEVFGGMASLAWVQAEAARLEEQRVEIEQRRLKVLIDLERYEDATADAARLLEEHSYREDLRHSQVVALYCAGRQADALAALDAQRRIMLDELGLDLSPELRDLQQRVLQQDQSLAQANPNGQPLRSYRVGVVLAAGRRATVYRGTQPDIGLEVVLKVFSADVANDATFVERFESNARRIAQLDHPHIVPVVDFWREPDRAVVVTRRTHGEPLASLAARRNTTLDEALAAAADVADALRHAHRNGVIHGAVSPANILVDAQGRSFLTDFELALGQAQDASDDFESLVQAFKSVLEPRVAEAFTVEVRPQLGEPNPNRLPNPYVGLGSFGEENALVFFGREGLVSDLVARLEQEQAPFLALVGPSGAGKSSVVHAGLIPELRRRIAVGGLVSSFVPGSNPLRALVESFISIAVRPIALDIVQSGPIADAVAELLGGLDAGVGDLVLVVDQFEEAFALDGSAFSLDRFFQLIAAICEDSRLPVRARVVVAMRSEYLDKALEHRALAPLLQNSTVAVGPMRPEELEEVIRAPARMNDVVVESGLVSRLVAEMLGRAGALPLLQFTMTRLFSERSGPSLGVDEYESFGGLGGALQSHAEAVAAELACDEETLRRILLQLVRVEEDRPATRRRVSRRELLAITDVNDDMLTTFTAARLVMSDRDPASREPTLEFTHEAILWSWPRLAAWIDDDRQLLAQRERVVAATSTWIADARDDALLLTGLRLEAARELVARDIAGLNEEQVAYVRASELAHIERREKAKHDLERERIRTRRLRLSVGAMGLALLIAIGLGAVAGRESSRANSEADAATTVAIANRSLVESTDRAEISLLLALEAAARDEGVASQQALLAALERSPPPAVAIDAGLHGEAPPTFCQTNRTPNGSFLSLGGDNVYVPSEAVVVDPADWSVQRLRSKLWCMAWSNADGKILAGRGANTDIVVDGADGSLLLRLESDIEVVGLVGDTVFGLHPRPGERGLAGELNAQYDIGVVRTEGAEPAHLIAVDARTGERSMRSDIVAERAVVSPDGERVLTWDGRAVSGRVRGLLDVATLETIADLGTGAVSVAGWSQDGSVVVVIAPSGAAEIRSRDGELLASGTVSLPSGTRQLAYDPESGSLALLGRSEVRVFRADRPFVEVASFRVDDAPQGLGWLSAGRLAVVERSGLIRVYDLFADYGVRRTVSCCESGGLPRLLHGPYGTDGEHLVDLDSGTKIDLTAFGGIAPADSLLVASLPDGRILTVVDAPYPPEIRLFDPATNRSVTGRPFEYELLVSADALIILPSQQPGTITVGVVQEFVAGVTIVHLVDVDETTLEPLGDQTQLSLPTSYFWNREPTIWQAGPARFEQWDASATLRSEPIDYTDRFLRGGLSPSGRWLLLIDRGNEAVVFDATTGDRLGALPVEVDLTDPVVFDDGRAVVRELGGSIALWDLTSARRIGSIGLATGPSGSRMIPSVDASGVWYVGVEGFVLATLDVGDWRRAACQLVTRELSVDEWDELVGDGEPVSRCPDQ